MTKPRYLSVKDIKSDEERLIFLLAQLLANVTSDFIDGIEKDFGIYNAKEVGPILFNGVVNFLHQHFTMTLKNVEYSERAKYMERCKENICHILDKALYDLTAH